MNSGIFKIVSVEMNKGRVRFSENNNIFLIPNDKPNIIARMKFSRIKATKYDPQNCEICKISCNSKKIYEMHIIGKKHVKALEKFSESKFLCDLCSLTFDDLNSWSTHIKSTTHIKAEQNNFSIAVFNNNEPKQVLNNINFCEICQLDCGTNIILQSHMTGSKHKRKLKLLKIEKLKDEKDPSVYCDICEITLEPELMFMHKKSNKHKKVIVKENNSVTKSKNSMEHCVICNKDFTLFYQAIEHYKTEEHFDNVKNNENNCFWCEVCKILLHSETMFEIHLKGFRHYRILNREECQSEGTYKDKISNKREKQRQLREKFESEKKVQEIIDEDLI